MTSAGSSLPRQAVVPASPESSVFRVCTNAAMKSASISSLCPADLQHIPSHEVDGQQLATPSTGSSINGKLWQQKTTTPGVGQLENKNVASH